MGHESIIPRDGILPGFRLGKAPGYQVSLGLAIPSRSEIMTRGRGTVAHFERVVAHFEHLADSQVGQATIRSPVTRKNGVLSLFRLIPERCRHQFITTALLKFTLDSHDLRGDNGYR
jgi:hypothetical protein